jgi:hypothetical protein
LVGLAVADRLGWVRRAGLRKTSSNLRSHLSRFYRCRRGIEKIFAPPKLLLSLLTEDTIIGRCEEVTAGQLRGQLGKGICDMKSLKSITRMSMGRCQGRHCLGTFAEIIAQECSCDVSDVALPRVRPPLKPIPLGDLLHEPLPPLRWR